MNDTPLSCISISGQGVLPSSTEASSVQTPDQLVRPLAGSNLGASTKQLDQLSPREPFQADGWHALVARKATFWGVPLIALSSRWHHAGIKRAGTCLSVVGLIVSAAFAGGPLKKSKTPSETTYHPQTGDVVFQSLPHNPVIDAIEGCTASPYSHCGIVVKNDTGWLVLEAVGPVKETPLRNWVLQGRKWEFSVCRLKPAYQPKIEAMVSAAREFKGRPYDIQYEFDDAKIYCSELIFKAFRKAAGEPLGATCKLGDLNWMPHQRVIRQITGGTLPLDREMITPRELALAKQLTLLLPFGNHLIE